MNRFVIYGAALALTVMCALQAQEFRSTIGGAITDQQGAVMPNITVVAVQIDTGATFRTKSSEDGQYTLPFVPPGLYRVEVAATGFRSFVRTGIQISANERVPLDIQLELGAASETVEVAADASIIETATASTGQVITSRQIENIPLNGRTPLTLAQLSFGVIPNADPRFNRPFDNGGPSGFSIGGAPAQTNEILLDGAPDVTANQRVSYNPPVDVVQQVKVEIFQADAAAGHSGGGIVNQVTKGGANNVHGTLYEFNQTSALESRNFFLSRSGQRLPVGRFNQYGGTFSGPVYIPKVFDGRNKLFFFFAYEGIKDSYPETITLTVPTALERRGDFSQLLNLGSRYQIYNPYSGQRQGSRIVRQPFTGNVIPANLLNPVALSYLNYYPAPNVPGQVDGAGNYVSNATRSDTFDSEFGRLDYNISERHKIFGAIHTNGRVETRGNRLFNIASGNFLSRDNIGATIDDVFTINPTTLLNTRIAWNRFTEANAKPSDGFNFSSLGFPTSLVQQVSKLVLPIADIGGFQQLGDNGGNTTPFDIFSIFTSLNKVVGQHSMKAGFDIRMYRESNINFGNSSGTYTFRTDWTRGPLDNTAASPIGQDFAAFLLGLPSSGGIDRNAGRTNQAGYNAVYFQDDYRVRQNLTLNLGVRWDKDLGTTERYNRSLNGFDIAASNPIGAAAQAAYAASPAALLPAGQFRVAGGPSFASADSRKIYTTPSHYFSPRFGFAWTPSGAGGKTVIRGGFSQFYFPIVTTGVNQSGFSQTTDFVSTLNSYLSPNATLSNPFPNGLQDPTGSSLGAATNLGKTLTFYRPNPLNPYSLRWTIGVQRQLTKDTVLEVGYIGNHAVHLPVDTQIDPIPRQYLSTSPTRDQASIDRTSAVVTNPFAGLAPGTTLNGSTVQANQLLRPFPQFTGITMQGDSIGSSYFHMVQVRLEKRFGYGLQFSANYLHSRLMERRSRLNETDLVLEKRVSTDDRPNRFVTNFSYELPFGHGKLFGRNASRLVDGFIGGWLVAGVYTFQSGMPVPFGNVIYLGGPLQYDSHNADRTFDRTQFNTNSAQQLANNIRTFPSQFNNIRQDGSNTMDASLMKTTTLLEKLRLQFRAEFFNVWNHPQFNAPDTGPTSSNFGKVTTQANDIGRVGQLSLRLIF